MELEGDSRRALRDFLSSYDTNNDGIIDASELGVYLRQMGMRISDKGVDFLRKSLDNNGDGRLQIDELLDNMETINSLAITDEELIHAFKVIDTKKKGFITIQELRKVLMHGSECMTPQEASAVIEQLLTYDKNRDGKFSYQEFVAMYMNSDFPFKPKKQVAEEHDPFKQIIFRTEVPAQKKEKSNTKRAGSSKKGK